MTGIGPQFARAAAGTDPRGWLVFESLPDDLQKAEDATAAADIERHRSCTYRSPGTWGITDPEELAAVIARARTVLTKAGLKSSRTFPRPATLTERILLQHLGFDLPAELFTAVSFPTHGVRNRRWPQLAQEVTP